MIDPNPPSQTPAIWASHVGRVAAAIPTDPLQPHPLSATPSPVSRLAAAAAHLHRRMRAKEEAERTARTNDFLVGD
jgi:hypothetical protein